MRFLYAAEEGPADTSSLCSEKGYAVILLVVSKPT